MAAYTEKLYDHTIRNRGSQVIDSPVSTFLGLKVKRNRYGKKFQLIQSWKFLKLNDRHCNHQTLCILEKKGQLPP